MDLIDHEIVAILQREGRLSNLALSGRLGLSPSATLGRVRRLEKSGTIRGYRAVLDPKMLGIGVRAIVAGRLSAHSEDCIKQFEANVRRVPGVQACYHVTGHFDMIMHVAVPDLDRLAQLIRVEIADIPGVLNLETMLVLAESVVDEGWPIPPLLEQTPVD